MLQHAISSCQQNFLQSIHLNEQGFSIEIEILSKFLKTKNKIKEVPIKYEGRTYSEVLKEN